MPAASKSGWMSCSKARTPRCAKISDALPPKRACRFRPMRGAQATYPCASLAKTCKPQAVGLVLVESSERWDRLCDAAQAALSAGKSTADAANRRLHIHGIDDASRL